MARFWETVAGALLVCAAMALAPAVGSCWAAAADPSPIGAAVGEEAGEEEVICVGDNCTPLPPEPEDPTPGTLVPNAGNPPLRFFEPKKHGRKRRHGRHGKPRRGEARRAQRPAR